MRGPRESVAPGDSDLEDPETLPDGPGSNGASAAPGGPVGDEPTGDEPSRPARSRRRRWVKRALLGGLAAAVLLGIGSAIPALAMKGDLDRGKAELTDAERLLLDGDLDAAASAFGRAQAAFESARSEPGAILLRIDGLLPLLGRTPDALLSLADIGRDLSSAGAAVSNRVADLPGGLEALGPKDGRLPIDTLASLAPVMASARAELDRAQARAERLPNSFVLGPVAGARDLLRQKLDRAVPLARAADALMHQLPAFAGANGAVRYFVAPQNLAEARGTGGLVGNFSVLTIDHGRFSFAPFASVDDLKNLPASQAPAPSALYDAFGGGGFWLNLNMTPDAPSAATMMEALFQRVRGTHLDGTVFVDLQALADLLKVTGPIRIPEFDTTITSGNVVEFVASAQYHDIPPRVHGVSRETEGPRLVAEAVLGRFFARASGKDAVRALIEAAAGGHIVLHSANPEVQAALAQAGVSGGFGPPDPGSDFFGVAASNAAANKVDYYVQRDVRYEVDLGPNGTGTSRATVTFRNDAPAGARPSYALGPNAESGLRPGEDRLWVSLYTPVDSRVSGSTENGKPLELPYYRDLGLALRAGFVEIEPQASDRLALAMARTGLWHGDVAAGTYTVRLQGQPSVRPTTATVVVRAPAGMAVAWTSVPMEVDGATATWHGVLVQHQDITVRFGKPAVLAVWSRFWHLFSRPAVRL